MYKSVDMCLIFFCLLVCLARDITVTRLVNPMSGMIMKVLSMSEIVQVSGSGCNWHDFGQDVVRGGIGSDFASAVTGGSVSFGALTMAG